MVEAGRTRTFRYWLEALRAKYEGEGEGEVYGKVEFDKLLGEFSVSLIFKFLGYLYLDYFSWFCLFTFDSLFPSLCKSLGYVKPVCILLMSDLAP